MEFDPPRSSTWSLGTTLYRPQEGHPIWYGWWTMLTSPCHVNSRSKIGPGKLVRAGRWGGWDYVQVRLPCGYPSNFNFLVCHEGWCLKRPCDPHELTLRPKPWLAKGTRNSLFWQKLHRSRTISVKIFPPRELEATQCFSGSAIVVVGCRIVHCRVSLLGQCVGLFLWCADQWQWACPWCCCCHPWSETFAAISQRCYKLQDSFSAPWLRPQCATNDTVKMLPKHS